MEVNQYGIKFNPEERHITALPERLPLAAVNAAFLMTRRARDHCFGRFRELLTCDVELLTDERCREIHLYPDRLRRLDELSQKMVPLVAPRMVAELEDNMDLLAAAVGARQ